MGPIKVLRGDFPKKSAPTKQRLLKVGEENSFTLYLRIKLILGRKKI